MILERHFIEDHLKFAKPGSFVQGRRAMLTEAATNQVITQANWQWDMQALEKQVIAAKKLKRSKILCKLLGYPQKNAKNIRSCNMAFWMKDLVAVNGFDSNFIGWGREDSELAQRLINYGVLKRHLRYSAIALHLYHSENSRALLQENDDRLKNAINRKNYTYCENGLDKINLNH